MAHDASGRKLAAVHLTGGDPYSFTAPILACENLSLPGRIAVRGPMQWSSRHAGGFSAAAELWRPACADGPNGYHAVNVLGQRHEPGSLYSWMAHAIRVRRECPELGWGEWRTLDVGDERVLAIENRWRDGHLVTLHNLSAEPAVIRLPRRRRRQRTSERGAAGSGRRPVRIQEWSGHHYGRLRIPLAAPAWRERSPVARHPSGAAVRGTGVVVFIAVCAAPG